MIGVDRMSSGEVFDSSTLMGVATSSGEVTVNADSLVVNGVGGMSGVPNDGRLLTCFNWALKFDDLLFEETQEAIGQSIRVQALYQV